MGIETYWIANGWSYDSLPPGINIDNTLFMFEKEDMRGMPISKSSTYLFHMMGNKPDTDSSHVLRDRVGRQVDWRQFSTNYWQDRHYEYTIRRPEVVEVAKGTLFEKSSDGVDKLYCAWATDLLPSEIDLSDMHKTRENVSWYIGTVGGGRGGIDDCLPTPEIHDNRKTLIEFRESCKQHGIEFKTNCPWLNPLSQEVSKKLIQDSFLAVDSRHPTMVKWGYIPCRLMKNMSYGQLGLTNSDAVHEFFEGETIYSDNGHVLFEEGLKHKNDYEMIKRQMMLVKDKHTYVNRARAILQSLSL